MLESICRPSFRLRPDWCFGISNSVITQCESESQSRSANAPCVLQAAAQSGNASDTEVKVSVIGHNRSREIAEPPMLRASRRPRTVNASFQWSRSLRPKTPPSRPALGPPPLSARVQARLMKFENQAGTSVTRSGAASP